MADEGFEFPVDRTQVMLFARSLLDIRPEFSDPKDPATKAVGGIVVPPTFVQCSAHWQPNYGLDLTRRARAHTRAPRDGERRWWRHRARPSRRTALRYHQPSRGDTLTATFEDRKRWEKEGRRGATPVHESITEYRTGRRPLLTAPASGPDERDVDRREFRHGTQSRGYTQPTVTKNATEPHRETRAPRRLQPAAPRWGRPRGRLPSGLRHGMLRGTHGQM